MNSDIESKSRKQQNQNKEFEQFIYAASHDLQEPLQALITFAERIKEGFSDKLNGPDNEYLKFILQSSARMQEMVKGLLGYSKIGKDKELTYTDCNQVIRDVISDMTDSIKESNAKITVENLPKLNGYLTDLRQLFHNLIGNAVKFRREGIIPEIKISVEKQLDDWLFRVEDNGIGINENHKEEIFYLFTQLHKQNEYKGNGIGLANCKKIIELHGGSIWIESKPGVGSVFYFTIPTL